VASATRLPSLPDVPTSAEVGLRGYESSARFRLVVPRGTPRPIVHKLNAEVAAAVADPAVRTRFVEFGTEPLTMSPEEMGATSPPKS
jgi:tripartite-type tricarboxylate transporter receptor subunit TctC